MKAPIYVRGSEIANHKETTASSVPTGIAPEPATLLYGLLHSKCETENLLPLATRKRLRKLTLAKIAPGKIIAVARAFCLHA